MKKNLGIIICLFCPAVLKKKRRRGTGKEGNKFPFRANKEQKASKNDAFFYEITGRKRALRTGISHRERHGSEIKVPYLGQSACGKFRFFGISGGYQHAQRKQPQPGDDVVLIEFFRRWSDRFRGRVLSEVRAQEISAKDGYRRPQHHVEGVSHVV